jgi:hypothetical protein
MHRKKEGKTTPIFVFIQEKDEYDFFLGRCRISGFHRRPHEAASDETSKRSSLSLGQMSPSVARIHADRSEFSVVSNSPGPLASHESDSRSIGSHICVSVQIKIF